MDHKSKSKSSLHKKVFPNRVALRMHIGYIHLQISILIKSPAIQDPRLLPPYHPL